MKEISKHIIQVMISIMVIVGTIIYLLWGKEISTILSVKQVGSNQYLYTMNYKANYDLDDIIASDIESNSDLLDYVIGKVGKGLPIKMSSSQIKDDSTELHTFGCTSFQTHKRESSGYYFGRNYDYFKNPTMVTINKPRKGYKSIAVSDMSHFGYSLDKVPNSLINKILCIASVYAPVDGMNEKGLCTSIMALPNQAAYQNTGKHIVSTTILMRLWLDRCATVEEAVDLVNSLDIRHDQSIGSGYHYMVADANGNSAVIEFDIDNGWQTMIVRKGKDEAFQHVTNHLLDPQYYTDEPNEKVGNVNSHSWWRYQEVDNYLSDIDGITSLEEAQECLSKVHWENLVWDNGMIEDTQYSNVYDQEFLTLYLRPWNEYETTFSFKLE